MKAKEKQFYKETGLSEDTPIEAVYPSWLVKIYCDDYSRDIFTQLAIQIKDGEVETVGDAIQYMNDYY